MRTLKKTLCLVLVLAMVMGFGVTAGAAYVDADKITYTEAVDVLSAIKVMEGDENGFRPTDTLTRAEACAIITRLLGAEDFAVATAQFKDVKTTDWFAGYVAFCYAAGIVDGYGNGYFGPQDKLTGYQWAKMLLCALGFDATAEGMTGDAWQIAVAKLAKANNIFLGNLEGDKTAYATREEAALYAFNLLDAYVVDYEGGTTFTVAGITFTQGGELKQSATTKFAAEYFPLLTYAGNTPDDFGRKAHSWYYGKGGAVAANFVGKYADVPAITYTSAQTKLATELKAYTVNDETYTTIEAIQTATGNGVLVELYIDKDLKITDVVVAPAVTVLTVKDVVATPATKTRGAYTTYTFSDNSTAKIFSTVINKDNDKDINKISGTLAKGDYVLAQSFLTGANAYTVYTKAATTGAGAVTGTTSAGVWTIGGKDYKLSAYSTANGLSIAVNAKDAKTNFVLDAYGYVIANVEGSTPDAVYGMLLKKDTAYTLDGTKLVPTYNAVVAKADGTVVTVAVAETAYAGLTAGTVYTLTANTNGTYTLGDASSVVKTDATIAKTDVKFDTLYVANTTKYVFANYVWSETANGYVVDGTVSTTTGVANVGSYTAPAEKTFYGIDIAVGGKTDGIADVVFVYENVKAATSAAYVYAMGTYTNDGTAYTNDAIVKGEATTVKSAAALTGGVLYSAVPNAGAATEATKYADGALSNYAGFIKVGTTVLGDDESETAYAVADGAVVYAINESYLAQGDVTVTTYTFADMTAPLASGEVYFQSVAGEIVAIYVVYTVA